MPWHNLAVCPYSNFSKCPRTLLFWFFLLFDLIFLEPGPFLGSHKTLTCYMWLLLRPSSSGWCWPGWDGLTQGSPRGEDPGCALEIDRCGAWACQLGGDARALQARRYLQAPRLTSSLDLPGASLLRKLPHSQSSQIPPLPARKRWHTGSVVGRLSSSSDPAQVCWPTCGVSRQWTRICVDT